MKEIETHAEKTLKLPSSVIAIGAFDGIHQGHRTVIRKAVGRSKILGVPSLVYTFDPPPRFYIEGVRILTTIEEKLNLLGQLGVDHTVIAKFDESFKLQPPMDFIRDLNELNPLEIIVGSSFRFGKNREGDIKLLKKYFNVEMIKPICCSEGKIISSTRIRKMISQGKIKESLTLLGR